MSNSSNSNITQLGGFQEAAEILTAVAGRTYSRQGIQQMWKRRARNGFPDRKVYSINGRLRDLFIIQDVADWYSYQEAADYLTARTGKVHTPSDVYQLWKHRKHTGFPDRKPHASIVNRLVFDNLDLEHWYTRDTAAGKCA